jgi:hypothetical protein
MTWTTKQAREWVFKHIAAYLESVSPGSDAPAGWLSKGADGERWKLAIGRGRSRLRVNFAGLRSCPGEPMCYEKAT